MRVLSDGNSKIQKCWGKGKPSLSQYRLINYTIQYEMNDQLALLNTVTGEVVLLDEDEKTILQQLPKPYQPEMDPLIEKHYLVRVDYCDQAEIDKLRKILKLLDRDPYFTSFTILPTTGCNARCFYCYESEYKHVSMTDETVEKTIRFIEQHCGKAKKLTIKWFGGEPLLGQAAIHRISEALTNKGFELSSSMITNGYLFTPELIRQAVDLWKLKNVQITLDGTRSIYNQVKSYRHAEGSPYDRVLDNIEELLKNDIQVTIRVNLDEHNLHDVTNLVDELLKRFSAYQKLMIYPHLLYKNKGFQPVNHTDEMENRLTQAKDQIERMLIAANHEAAKISFPSLTTNCCMADHAHHIMIHPEGSLVRCEHSYFDDRVGTIDDGITNLERFNWWNETEVIRECKSCAVYPTCIVAKHCPVHEKCTQATVNGLIAHYQHLLRKAMDPHSQQGGA